MDWKQYTIERRKTAFYPRKVALFYVLLKLVGEIAEVSAIAERADCNQAAVLGELGDVCWYIAAVQYELGISDLYLLSTNVNNTLGYADEMFSLYENAASIQQMVAKAYRDAGGKLTPWQKNSTSIPLIQMLANVNWLAIRAGGTLEGVLAANIAKLADRQARGVIGGSGDNR